MNYREGSVDEVTTNFEYENDHKESLIEHSE